jgi:hypothetical protein
MQYYKDTLFNLVPYVDSFIVRSGAVKSKVEPLVVVV